MNLPPRSQNAAVAKPGREDHQPAARAVIPHYFPSRRCRRAFTLVEMLVSMGVLALIMILISQLFNSATTITSMGNNHMDSDSQARAVFDRIAIDFAQIVKRADVDYYLKDPDPVTTQSGNDQMAFYSQVPGYYMSGTTAGVPSPVSVVGYRVNAKNGSACFNQLQRYGFGVFWNGMVSGSISSGTAMPLVFSGSSTTSTPNVITKNWPAASTAAPGDAGYEDKNYEPIGPDVFRFEYFYLIRGQTLADGTPKYVMLSDTPWDRRIKGITGVTDHTSVSGLRDVAAIGVIIAVINPKSRVLVSNSQLTSLAAMMADFPQTDSQGNYVNKFSSNGIDLTLPGGLEAQWMSAINDPTNGIPRIAASSIRVYKRYFYLSQSTAP